MAMYSKQEYWDERYKSLPNACSEWYQGYRSLRHLFNPDSFRAQGKGNGGGRIHRDNDTTTAATMETIPEQNEATLSSSSSSSSSSNTRGFYSTFPSPHNARVLILGCGNSSFAQDMRDDGWMGRMVNLDFSPVVIAQQEEKCRHVSPKFEFVCHDIREGLPFDNVSFDLIIAKASLDAILCGPSPTGYARRTIHEVVRCLAPGHGIFFLVTSGNPDSRLVYLEHDNQLYHYWDNVRHHAIPRPNTLRSKPKTDYVYVSRRKRSIPPTPESKYLSQASESTENQANLQMEKNPQP